MRCSLVRYGPLQQNLKELRHRRAVLLRDNKKTYESLDYDRCENQNYRRKFFGLSTESLSKTKRQRMRGRLNRWVVLGVSLSSSRLHVGQAGGAVGQGSCCRSGVVRQPSTLLRVAAAATVNITRWATIFAIGTATAVVAFAIDTSVETISEHKFNFINSYMVLCSEKTVGCISRAYGVLLGMNLAFVLFAVVLCVYVAPSAAGSGIPEIKCALNGVKRRDWLTFKTLLVKVTGVIAMVSATMPVGKEGPMIHSGAIIGAGLPQGRSTRLGWDWKTLMFRSDRAKRDFVAAGAAAGVAAAFGAQIGGVLFSLEEGASFWNQSLTWRILFCTMSALFVLHLLNRINSETAWDDAEASGGLVSFGDFE